jgi:transcriptional regulator with XRE-family HTH domain
MEVVDMKVTIHEEPSVQRARRLRYRREVDRLDYLRTVRALASNMRQEDLAKHLGVTQPAISATLRKAREIPDLTPGFSGASPYEIAERYAAGQIDREQLIDELGRFPYAPTPRTDGYDWLTDDVANTTGDVGDALDDGLIDEDTYVAIQHRITEHRQTASS